MKTKTILKSDFGRQNERPKICPYFSLGSVKLNTELASVRVHIHAHYTPEPSGKSIIIARHPCLCARTKTYEAVNRAANTPAHLPYSRSFSPTHHCPSLSHTRSGALYGRLFTGNELIAYISDVLWRSSAVSGVYVERLVLKFTPGVYVRASVAR